MDLIERVALNARIGAGRIWEEALGEWAMQLDKDIGDQAAIKEIADGLEAAARAAIAEVLDAVGAHLSAVQYDPAPYTAMKHRLAQLRKETGEG